MSYRVLYIDDSTLANALVAASLAGEDVELQFAADGNAGLAAARAWNPDVILLDVEMPAPDGFEVCRQLKRDPALLNTPVIFVSGRTTVEEKLLGLELGAVDYLSKPIDPADLKARLRTALRLKRLTDLLSARAQIDAATGLWTEDYFNARMSAELKLAARTGHPIGLLLTDIDRFKLLNAEHGQWWGDQILRQVGERLVARTREEDVLCRLGASFALICPVATSAGLFTLADRLSVDIARLNPRLHNVETPISASFGFAVTCAGACTPDDIRGAAQRALASAKSRGGNRVAEGMVSNAVAGGGTMSIQPAPGNRRIPRAA